ncbi:CBS domain-containing protein [Micromonospora sp. CPCC 205711]|uniref:CBS domain-containing protein n=1 Tax=Micromonospora sp. CPCC 205547 TaxID=3122400 RepID=UPI002FF141E2
MGFLRTPVNLGSASSSVAIRDELEQSRFLRVSQLVPDDQDIVTVMAGTPVREALGLMRSRRFDQLPVMTTDGRVVGAFTYRSFSANLRNIRPQDDPLGATVDDLVEDLNFVRPADELSATLTFIERDNAVLVGDEDRLLAIVTTADVSRFLWRRTRPYVLLESIELAVRDLMHTSCSAEELRSAVAAALKLEEGGQDVGLEDLTLSELLTVLLNGNSFGRFFRLRFGNNRQLVSTTLAPVREIRNKVFHFRGDLSEQEIQCLHDVSVWLRRKVLIRGGGR